MKKVFLFLITLLLSLNLFSAVPEFKDGKVIDLKDYPQKFNDKIILVNYSSLEQIRIDFSVYLENDWRSIGTISTCPFGENTRLATKERIKKIEYIGYKTELPANIKIVTDISHHDLYLYILETSNKYFGTSKIFSDNSNDPKNGIYCFNTTAQRKNYEDNVKIENGAKSIIMFLSPDTGVWDVYGIISNGKFKSFYSDDIDDFEPYWIIQVLDEHKYYNISASAKHSDLYFSFKKAEPFYESNSTISSDESDLLKLKEMYEKGLIDNEEYKLKKAKILGL